MRWTVSEAIKTPGEMNCNQQKEKPSTLDSNQQTSHQSNTTDNTALPTPENDRLSISTYLIIEYQNRYFEKHSVFLKSKISLSKCYNNRSYQSCQSSLSLTQPPSIRIPIPLVKRIQLLVPLLPCESNLVSELEKVRSHIYQPFWIYSTHLSHILL